MTVAALLLLALGTAQSGAVPSTPLAHVEPAVRDALEASLNDESYVLVVLKRDGLPPALDRESSIHQLRTRLLEELAELPENDFRPVYLWRHVAGLSAYVSARGLDRLARHELVERIGVDLQGSGQLGTSVPFIGAATAHAGGVTGSGITIAVIDTGVDTDHPDIAQDIAPGGMHFLMQGADVGPSHEDVLGHGTAVAGTITSDGVSADFGVAPNAKILPIQVVSSDGQSFLSDWVTAVDYVISEAPQHARLAAINMSLASNLTFIDCPCDSTAAVNVLLGDAIKVARHQEILTFASSGNGGECSRMASPACLESAIAVAAVYEANLGREPVAGTYQAFFGPSFGACFDATTQGDQIACFSNRNDCNELAAPGRSIASSSLGGGVNEWTGTSQASPHVAGALALLLESTGASTEACLTALKLSGIPTTDECSPSVPPVRVDVAAAMLAATPFQPFCFGDGGNQAGCTECPCGNNAPTGERGGCTHSAGASGRLRVSGVPRVSNDSLRFDGRSLPPGSAALLISGANRLPVNPANPCSALATGIPTLGDGLRCSGGALRRHGVRSADSTGAIGDSGPAWGGAEAPQIGLISQGGFAAGQTRHFQAFFRDVQHGSCNAGLNSTQAISLTLLP